MTVNINKVLRSYPPHWPYHQRH